jgi:hypothetical protein
MIRDLKNLDMKMYRGGLLCTLGGICIKQRKFRKAKGTISSCGAEVASGGKKTRRRISLIRIGQRAKDAHIGAGIRSHRE